MLSKPGHFCWLKQKGTINNHPNTLWANHDCFQQIWTDGHHSHLWAVYKMKKWPGYQESNLWNLNLLCSSSAVREVIYPPESIMNTRLHSTEPPGWEPELGLKQVLTEHLSLSPTAFLNQFHWLQRSFEEKRRTFEMCVKTTTERAYLAAFLAHRLRKYYLVNVSQCLSIQQHSLLFNRR